MLITIVGLCWFVLGLSPGIAQTTHVITNQGRTFVPDAITIQQGDIIDWQIAGNHNVIQVSEATFNANGNTQLPGGFSAPFGGGQVTFNQAGTFYYVCVPHAGAQMKGIVTVQAASSENIFAAKLTGAQEALPKLTTGSGQLRAEVRNDSLFVSGSLSGLSSAIDVNIAGGAHIHAGLAGQNGPIVFPLTFNTSMGGTAATFDEADNGFFLRPGQLDTLRARGMYVNIHTTQFASGELRGQILPTDPTLDLTESFFSANLFGSNEVPSIMTDASGAVVLDVVGDTLTVTGSFANLSAPIDLNIAGGAHLHDGLAGENGGIAFFLKPTVDMGGLSGRFEADSNRFILDASQKAALAARAYYVNIHSEAFGSGELRGQVVGMPLATFRAFLAGAQEVPSVISAGQGELAIELFTDSIVATGTFKELGSAYNAAIGSHLHLGYAGSNGGVEVVLDPTLDTTNLGGAFQAANNGFGLSTAQLDAMLGRQLYVNIHTLGNASGEIRGQVVPEASYFLYSLLSATQEVTPQVSPAYGAGILEVRGGEGVFTGSFNELANGFNENIAGGAHLHAGYAGQNGPVVFFLNPDLNAGETAGSFAADSNVFTLAATTRDTIRDRFLYVNIHSDTIVSGELRGQVLGEAQNYFFSPLSGTSELVPVNSTGFGNVVGEWLNGDLLTSGSFSALSSPFNANVAGGAHIHRGLAGQTGGIEWFFHTDLANDSLSGIFPIDSNRFTLSAGQTDTLISRGYYVNIHTLANGGGELRGQFLPPANGYFTTSLAGKNETEPNDSQGVGGFKAELVQDRLIVSGAFGEILGDFDASIAGGAHLHAGQVGSNGGIELFLNVELAANLKVGTFEADSNQFMLSQDQLDLLLSESLYANIHSTLFPSGELRGQLLPETNEFPTDAPVITAPPSGAAVTIAGDPATPFVATWSDATDPDGNPLAYIWELAPTADFAVKLLRVNVGQNTTFATDFGTVDALLAANSIPVGASLKVYHRAVALDGAVCLAGGLDSVTVTRGMVTQVSNFAAKLTGAQEVQPILTTATGLLDLQLRDDTLLVSGNLSGLSSPIDLNIAGGAHIHMGLAGQNGGIVLPLTFTTSQGGTAADFPAADNTFILSQGKIDTLLARGYYVNIHTEQFGSGELRGQILPTDDALSVEESFYSTNLFGSNEVPSIMTEAAGALVLDVVGDTLTVTGSFSNLSTPIDLNIAGGAHLHDGQAGENGGIAFFLKPVVATDGLSGSFEADSNQFVLTQAEKDALANRAYYVNIHSEAFGSGELRGQVVGMPLATFRAFLAGAQEVPSVISAGQGELAIELFTDSIVASGTFQDLGSGYNGNIGSHLHLGYAGSNGGVEVVLAPTLDMDSLGGRFEVAHNGFGLDSAQEAVMLGRQLYVNIHTLGSPSGELRGQVVPEANYFLYSLLSATQEVSPQVSPGFGAGVLEVRGDEAVFTGSFNELTNGFNEAIAGGAHLHTGYAGQNGGILFALTTDLNVGETAGTFVADANTFEVSDTKRDTIKDRFVYVNIHSDSIPSGELRGQVLGEAQNYFFAPLSGTSEQTPVNTTGQGTVAGEWLNGDLIVSGAFSDLTSPFDPNVAGGAHIHRGLAGENGGIELFLNTELAGDNLSGVFPVDSNRWSLSAGQTDTLISRGYYVNIHTEANAGGELRGQVLPPANGYFTTTLAGKNETEPNTSAGIGALKLELVRDQLVVSGAFEGFQGDFDVNIMGGAHLHAGQVGTNGGIEVLLTSELAGDLKSGTFAADSNLFMLTPAQLDLLLTDGLYANLHSTDFPSGELRGQILAETNAFPAAAPTITAPASGASVTIEGDPASPFIANWDGTTDPDGNPLAYIWQLAPAADFSTLLVNVNVGDTTAFVTDFSTVNGILIANGIEFGDSIQVYHRAIAIDGAVCQTGASDSVILKRGVITSLTPGPAAEFRVFPSPASTYLQVELSQSQAQELSLQLVDLRGKVVRRSTLPVTGSKISARVDLQGLSTGMYQLIVADNQGLRWTQKVIKE